MTVDGVPVGMGIHHYRAGLLHGVVNRADMEALGLERLAPTPSW